MRPPRRGTTRQIYGVREAWYRTDSHHVTESASDSQNVLARNTMQNFVTGRGVDQAIMSAQAIHSRPLLNTMLSNLSVWLASSISAVLLYSTGSAVIVPALPDPSSSFT